MGWHRYRAVSGQDLCYSITAALGKDQVTEVSNIMTPLFYFVYNLVSQMKFILFQ